MENLETGKEKEIKRFEILFWVLLSFGVVGFLDFLSKPFVTTITESHFGRDSETQISFLMAIYIDLANSGMGFLGLPFLWTGIILSNGLFAILLIAALFVRQHYKKLKSAQNNPTEKVKTDWVGYKKLSPRLKWVVIGIFVLYILVLLFAD